MINFKSLLILSSLCVSSLAYSQNYGYNPNYSNYQMQPGYYSQPYGQQDQSYGGGYQPYQPYQPNQNQYYQQGYQPDNRQSNWSNEYGKDNKDQKVPDEVITTSILQNIRSTPYLSPSARNIQAETKDGKVTLKGKVMNKNEGYQIEYMAKNVQGVKSVSNDLESEK